ncbi:MAG: 16S rRNA (uracil(1498)-N(3))-methyltransferase [Holosporaceae bacterium]|jgi:16S rRNA (uracil1498-N3)-methyltransferase|nr:16S rRNA (uracil(1498)-N(3))-methyltransferase [Holosporaceae bacterium]
MKHIPRFYIDSAILQPGAMVSIGLQRMHHATRVLRLSVGDSVRLFHENYGEWNCSISNVKTCSVTCLQQIKFTENEVRSAIIACAIIHPTRMCMLLEKVTELGASAIIPLISQYTQYHTLNIRKAVQIICSACEQCGRIKIPQLHEIVTLEEFLQTYDTKYGKYQLIFGDESLTCSVKMCDLLKQKKNVFLIGPEGGFSSLERRMILSYNFASGAKIGSNILRSETAAMAFMSAWLCTIP